ncbi:GNAT family N-acetyltransferase [uncultured Photobacterium sp.]|uniref:tRNA(Met) cytidine acetyltransferase TmcA n=1 Tax=uncultured Photobacterium sp. TaxID=173973 RepID=UPI00262A3D96|nr:GNAT family N-acetyltransferase [uncultured Photobacterium sp.]
MSELTDFCSALIIRAKQANVRYLVAIEGTFEWGSELACQFASLHNYPLWAGDLAPELLNSVALKKAKKWLGQECDCLIFNAYHGFDVEALGALSGTVIGGGGMLMLLPPQWFNKHECQSPSIRRLTKLLSLPEVLYVRQGQPLPPLPELPVVSEAYSDSEFGCLTADQHEAVAAIRRVVTGHRKRPLVLTADRGRGKSTALGIAAASLMTERKIRIGVTAPAFANADTLISHVARRLQLDYHQQKLLEYDGSQLQFFAPDLLLAEAVALDFLIVDEAAAIPAPILTRLLSRYNRIAFASTVHGYEGTGRGFAIKFRQQLDVVSPQWRQLQLCQPIRWAEPDPLEKWTFRTLLLDADYPSLANMASGDDVIKYRVVASNELVEDENLLAQVFGLLINAHYQTSPADMVQLLDDNTVQLVVAELDDVIVGCCLLSLEGGFSDEMANDIMLGKRRPKGHLLAQSVAAHIGLTQGAVQRSARIMRIAVHPELQQQGIGLELLVFCRRLAEEQQLDYLGTSFGLVSELFDFWHKAGYLAVRLGIKKDAASGAHSLLMVLPLSRPAHIWVSQALVIFALNFQAQRVEQFSDLDTELFLKLHCFVKAFHDSGLTDENPLILQQLETYARGGLGYDLVVANLEYWLQNKLGEYLVESAPVVRMAVSKVMQRQSWDKVVVDYGFASKKMAEKALRDWVASQLLLFPD